MPLPRIADFDVERELGTGAFADWLGRLPSALREGVDDRIAVFAAIRHGVPLAP